MSTEQKQKLEKQLWKVADVLRGKMNANKYNLNIPRYVDTFEEEELVDIAKVAKELQGFNQKEQELQKEIGKFCKELKIDTPF